MAEPATLRALSDLPDTPAALGDSTLVMIDCQNTYTRGVLELDGVQQALDHAEALLQRARSAGATVIHVMHDDGPGSLYDIDDEIGRIVPRVAPDAGEEVVVKQFPNAFVDTNLHELLSVRPEQPLVLAGFMTHMCINSTARAAFNLGYQPTVVASATATRSLPGPDGVVPATLLHRASLAALADLFAIVVPDPDGIPG